MAEHLIMKMGIEIMHFLPKSFRHQLIISLGVICWSVSFIVNAGTLTDPTQPPASLYSNNGEAQNVATGPVLQSVMIGSQYRAAIISGQKVMLGGKYGDATLIRLNDHEAVLRNADKSTQKLEIDYAIDKKVLSPVTPAVKKRKTKHSRHTK